MSHVQMRIPGCLAAVALLAACGGGHPPTISDLELSSTTVAPGGQVTGQLRIADPDGLGGLKVNLRVTGAGAVPVDQTVSVGNATDALTEALVPFFVQVTLSSPRGDYQAVVTAIDGDGNRSNDVSVAFKIQ